MNTNTASNFPMLVPTETAVVVANMLPSGAAFVVRLDNGDNCYVPVNVSLAASISIGEELCAKLVPNRFPDKVERTPWLTVHLSRPAPTSENPKPVQYAMPFSQFDMPTATPAVVPVAARVRQVMERGGVWTLASMFEELFPGKTRGDGLNDYNAVSTALRSMFADGGCAKFQLWRTSDQSKPSREWFTCYPQKADVDEWEDN
jgi:hypothetical protein